MHEQTFFNWLQALDLQQLGWHDTPAMPIPQADNKRLDSTPSFTTAQRSEVTVSRTEGWSG